MTQLEVITGIGDKAAAPAAYCIAGRRVLSDADAPELRPYQLQAAADWSVVADMRVMAAGPGDPLTFSGKGWVANAWHDVECRRANQGFELRFPDLATFWIAEGGHFIYLTAMAENCAQALLVELALGAPVVLAFALQGVYCLHVSVVQAGDRLVAFAAESGQGKSTLARFLGFESGPGWRRIIDDTLPVQVNEKGEIEALPHFPQLKLPDAYQPVNFAPPRMHLDALYVLADSGESAGSSIQIRPLTSAAATLAVVQHTLAAKLFDHRLLTRHLLFAEAFAAAVPVRSLAYPRSLDFLPMVRAPLLADLRELFDNG